jgi:hypothetical protein
MPLGTIYPYPYILPRVGNVVPFTYRTGATYLEILETLSTYIKDTLIPAIDGELDGLNTDIEKLLTDYVNDIDLRIMSINNRVGNESIQRGTLSSDFVLPVNNTWPDLHPIRFQYFQNVVGGHDITFGPGITGSVVVNPLPGAITEFELIPSGINTWYVSQIPTTRAQLDTAIGDLLDLLFTPLEEELTAALVASDARVDAAIAGVDARMDAASQNGFMVATFLANGVNGEKLSTFYSPDGKTIYGGGANPVYTPADGEGVRDPSAIRHNGKWYVAHTSDNGIDKDFQIAVSDTGTPGTWSLLTAISGASLPSLWRLWAPELIVSDGAVYVFFSGVTEGLQGSMYWIRAQNDALTSWTTPVALNFPTAPAHYIDGVPVKHTDGKFYLFYSTGQDICRAVSPTLTGLYVNDRTGNWAGWGTGIEGPQIVRDGPVYRAYFDRFQANTGYWWSESTDLNTWTAPVALIVAPGVLREGERIRHGSFVRLTDRTAANQVIASQGMVSAGTRNTEFANPVGIEVSKATLAWVNDVTRDDFETEDDTLVTWLPVTQEFRLNKLCTYAISVAATALDVTGVSRSFVELWKGDNVTRHLRGGGGAEDVFSLGIPNFKPRAAGETVKIRLFTNWTGPEAVGHIATRIRFTQVDGR